MAIENPLSLVREVGGAFRLGSGVLGKSAIALAFMILVGGTAILRLHSDLAILSIFGFMGILFFVWFFPVLSFCKDHPAAALLDGAEWKGYQKDQLEAKGYTPSPTDELPVSNQPMISTQPRRRIGKDQQP